MNYEPDNSDNLPVQAAHSAPMRHWVFGAAVVAVWLALWEFIVRSWPGGHKFFSPPSTFLILFFKSLFVTGELRPHLSATIQRLLVGMIIGGVPALWIGRAMGRSRPLRVRWGPVAAALGLIPVFSLLPTFTILFGIAEINKWAVVSWAVFLPILYTTSMAVRASEHLHENRRISKTGAWPYDSRCMFVGLKLSSIIGMLAVLGAEMWSAKVGLGQVIATAGSKFDIALIHVVMVAATLIMYAFWLGLTALEVSLRHRTAAKTTVGDR